MFVIKVALTKCILSLSIFTLCLGINNNQTNYKPVVILHGILSGSENMVFLEEQIKIHHPETIVYNCDKFDGWNSLESAWWQVQQIREYLKIILKLHPEGVHFIGYSQGGLLGRAILQAFPEHNVKNFISLSSPQAGQFGTDFLHLIFPDLAAKTAFELFYSRVGQHTSVGNYWNDPHKQDLYLQYSVFLPYINNEIASSNSTSFKNSLIKLNKLILIGGPNDGVITPWESSHFGYFNESLDVIPFEDREIYKTDAIGLKTLKDQGKLIVITRPNVHHLRWHKNKRVIRELIMPYLD